MAKVHRVYRKGGYKLWYALIHRERVHAPAGWGRSRSELERRPPSLLVSQGQELAGGLNLLNVLQATGAMGARRRRRVSRSQKPN